MKNKIMLSMDSSLKEYLPSCEEKNLIKIIIKLVNGERFTDEEVNKLDKFSSFVYLHLLKNLRERENISTKLKNKWIKAKSNGKNTLKGEVKSEVKEEVKPQETTYINSKGIEICEDGLPFDAFFRMVKYRTPEDVECTIYNLNMPMFNEYIKEDKSVVDFFAAPLSQYINDERLTPMVLINGDFFTSDKDNMGRLQEVVKHFLKYVKNIPAIKREDLEYFANKQFGAAEDYVNENNDPVTMINPL